MITWKQSRDKWGQKRQHKKKHLRVRDCALASARRDFIGPDLLSIARAVKPPAELGDRGIGGHHAGHRHIPAAGHPELGLPTLDTHGTI